LKILLIFAL